MMEQCNIQDIVNVEVKGTSIVIEPASQSPRAGWEEQFRQANVEKEENLLDGLANAFDESEWTW
ncbi:hypothetical protein [Dyadobacter sp. CY326]|uniref:AbrB/MazE/SpoVT family DNA-binding domain-containing protein n=1 Tax=Dyadobacter sp. CY326 TaxID=2907300 RepID=UPI001F37CB41|nr:hypothetical protein [Dyadobacter sp. CY326]MCE7068514.1 hypothetical protein [Dyadobacter sp. CY326]